MKKWPQNGDTFGYKFITFSAKLAVRNMVSILALFGLATVLATFQKILGDFFQIICGLYYKTITIIIMTIVSDATIWSVTLTIVIMTRLAKARIVNYDRL